MQIYDLNRFQSEFLSKPFTIPPMLFLQVYYFRCYNHLAFNHTHKLKKLARVPGEY